MFMKIACAKKIVSNIPVLASGCLMKPVYLAQYSVLHWFLTSKSKNKKSHKEYLEIHVMVVTKNDKI